MDATYIQQSIQQLKTNIFMHVRHRTLLQYTGEPVLDENQLFYLLLPFLNGEKWDDQLNESIITVGIVHASLSEHDKINELKATSKEQQLTVLSGDYYSGRYYEILAKSGNITLIRQLSEGIAHRCEHQIKAYDSNNITFSQWFESLEVIETELIKKFYSVYGFDEYNLIMQMCLLIIRLQKEIHNYQEGQKSLFALKLENSLVSMGDTYTFERVIHQEIDTLITNVYEYLNSSTFIKDELKLYIKRQIAFSHK